MSADLPEPARWCDLSARGASAENALGATFRRVRDATEPSDAAVARLTRRINAATAEPSTRFGLVWRVVVAALLLMATGGAVGAALNRWRLASAAHPATVEGHLRASVGRPGRKHGARVHAPMAEVSAPVVDPPTLDPPAALDPPLIDTPPPATPVAQEDPRPSEHRAAMVAPSSETALLASAFRELRSGGNPEAALRSLDRYDRRFPDGTLRSEARIARIEALLALDRPAEALRLLEELGAGAITRDVRITRAELLAANQRCAIAIRDFDRVLAVRDNDAPGARALYGRASCHLRAADTRAARQDLTRYLALNPTGPMASAARRALTYLP
jgi:tetratricopeptide (TPR) repeat protein